MTQNNLLPQGTVLNNRYCINKYLASGGFGNTYMAIDLNFESKVAIKELFIETICCRNEEDLSVLISVASNRITFDKQKARFIKEARRLHSFGHPNIVRVSDVFEENGTAYYVMDYVEGVTLSNKVRSDGAISEYLSRNYLSQILSALEYIHRKGVLHLDLKPGNIMVNQDDEVVLIDFGASKQYETVGEDEKSTTASALAYTPGYAPMEQTGNLNDKVGTYTDIYSLGATLYFILSGKKPPIGIQIIDSGLPRIEGVSDSLWQVIEKSMSVLIRNRIQTVAEFRKTMDISSVVILKNTDDQNDINCNETIVDEKTKLLNGDYDNIVNDDNQIEELSNSESQIDSNEAEEVYEYEIDNDQESSNRKKLWQLIAAVVLLFGVIFIWKMLYNVPQDNQENLSLNVDTIVEPINESAISEKEVNKSNVKKKTDQSIKKRENSELSNKNEKNVEAKKEKDNIIERKDDKVESNTKETQKLDDRSPQFPGGDVAFVKWIDSHLIYPTDAKKESIQGSVVVQFVVESDGSIGQVRVSKGCHPSLDKEAIRVIKSLPKFLPAVVNGSPMRCWYRTTVNFKLS
ncbi:MAG: TonB family protein [Bacteroidales bacterium]|nr:TonB family protein [Bacteroidales bacterium]